MNTNKRKSRQGRNVEVIEVRDIPYLTALSGLSPMTCYLYQVPNGTVYELIMKFYYGLLLMSRQGQNIGST
jgi:hypothetical protein